MTSVNVTEGDTTVVTITTVGPQGATGATGSVGPQGAAGIVSAANSGSAAAPSISFASDPNTGIYSPDADQLAISTGGSGRLFIDSSGRVGIGTTSPGYALDVRTTGTSISSSFTSDQSEQYIALKDSGTTLGHVRLGSTSGSMLFFAGNGERARIDSSGRLGVGTSAPVNSLQVTASAFASVPSAGSSGHCLAVGSLTYGLAGGALTNGNVYLQATRWDSAAINYDLLLQPNGGNVGIGTTNPATLFHAYSGAIDEVARFEATGSPYVSIYDSGVRQLYISVSSQVDFLVEVNKALVFSTNNTERARIDSSGRLLVGTSSDSGGALFQVNGDRIRVGTAKTPASASATGTAGEIAWDANYIYVCTATNTWKRSAIATW